MRVTQAPRAAAFILAAACAAAVPVAAQARSQSGPSAHMSFTASRPGTAIDSARALGVVRALRTAIQPYQTLDAAERAGYRPRRNPDSMRGAGLLHAGRGTRRFPAAETSRLSAENSRPSDEPTFDPRAPQALLFRRAPDGRMQLAGAMFVAPPGATADELDSMIPLSIAHWHRHLNVCVAGERGAVVPIPRASTPESCTAAGGRFRAESRYMVHVMIDGGDDLTAAFPQGQEQMEGMEMGGMRREAADGVQMEGAQRQEMRMEATGVEQRHVEKRLPDAANR